MTEPDMAKMTQLLTEALAELRTPLARQRVIFRAKDAFMNYTAYVGEGFTPAQALQLVMAKL